MLHADHASIEFKNIHFAYGEKSVLHGINLSVKAGQLVALVGASGSGKTTLANLLLRFYDPTKGSISIGGVDLREVNTRDLRNQIAVVAQENILFNDTIRRNIELGRLGATNDEIVAAARHAFAYEFIMEKEGGFDCIIEKKASRFPAASASASPSPAPFCGTHPFWFWTRLPARSTPNPNAPSRPRSTNS